MTQKLTLLSSRLPVSPALREANEHLISKATVSLAHPKSCSHIQGIATPAQQTLNNTALPSSLSEHGPHQTPVDVFLLPHSSRWGDAEISACGTGTLPQPGVSSAGPRWTGFWAFPMPPSQCKPFTDGSESTWFHCHHKASRSGFPTSEDVSAVTFQVPGA